MTDDELNRKMEFIIEQQAQFTVDIQLLKEAQASTAASVAQLTKDVLMLADTQSQMQEQAEADRQEMRNGINQMISIAEEMRDLARALVTAQIGTSQRVSKVEDRLDRLESDQP